MSIIAVGATAAYQSVEAALATAHDGDTLLCDSGRWDFPTGIEPKVKNLTIKAAPGASVTFARKGNENASVMKVRPWANGLTIDGIDFAADGCWALDIGNDGAKTVDNVTVRNCRLVGDYTVIYAGQPVTVGGFFGIKVSGSKNLLIDGFTIPKLITAYGCYFTTVTSEDAKVIGYEHHGSIYQHGFRAMLARRLYVSHLKGLVNVADPGTKETGAISVRGGCAGVVIEDSELHGLGVGPQIASETPVTDVVVRRCNITTPPVHSHYGGAKPVYYDCTRDGKPYGEKENPTPTLPTLEERVARLEAKVFG